MRRSTSAVLPPVADPLAVVAIRAVDKLQARVLAAMPLRRNYIVGISGIDGAGKSTFARALCSRFQQPAPGPPVRARPLDGAFIAP